MQLSLFLMGSPARVRAHWLSVAGNVLTASCAAGTAWFLPAHGRMSAIPRDGGPAAGGHPLLRSQEMAQPLTDAIRTRAQALAAAHSVQIEYIGKKRFRKEDRVAAVLKASGGKTGLIHIFSALEPCTTFKPWHDKTTGRTGLKMTAGQCLHYYFYFNDAQIGLCHLRVQSWAPFRIQLCLNGHNWLARWMDQKEMTYKMEDNAFVQIKDWAAAQEMAATLDPARLHTAFERLRREVIPFACGNEHFRSGVYWSVMQIEMSHDIIFKSQAALAPVYETISRQAMLAAKAPRVRFLGKPLPRESSDTPLGSDYHTRIEGTRIKHFMGPASLKMYDKRGRVLRIECTCNDMIFFKHHREVEKRDGTTERKTAPLKKSLYSLPDLRGLMEAACRRYLDFVSTLETPAPGAASWTKSPAPRGTKTDGASAASTCSVKGRHRGRAGRAPRRAPRERTDPPRPRAAAARLERRQARLPAQKATPARPDQKNRPNLQILHDKTRTTAAHHRPEAQGSPDRTPDPVPAAVICGNRVLPRT